MGRQRSGSGRPKRLHPPRRIRKVAAHCWFHTGVRDGATGRGGGKSAMAAGSGHRRPGVGDGGCGCPIFGAGGEGLPAQPVLGGHAPALPQLRGCLLAGQHEPDRGGCLPLRPGRGTHRPQRHARAPAPAAGLSRRFRPRRVPGRLLPVRRGRSAGGEHRRRAAMGGVHRPGQSGTDDRHVHRQHGRPGELPAVPGRDQEAHLAGRGANRGRLQRSRPVHGVHRLRVDLDDRRQQPAPGRHLQGRRGKGRTTAPILRAGQPRPPGPVAGARALRGRDRRRGHRHPPQRQPLQRHDVPREVGGRPPPRPRLCATPLPLGTHRRSHPGEGRQRSPPDAFAR